MSDDETGTQPGVTAADDAPTQAVPRLPRPAKKAASSAADASSTDGDDTAAQPAAKKAPTKKTPSTTTNRSVPARPPRKPTVAAPSRNRDDVTAVTRPTTAGDIAANAKRPGRPDETSEIPVVRDPLADTPKKKPTATVAPAPASGSRQAHLRVTHVDPWSVTKTAFALSVALMIVAVVAVIILWLVLQAAGVWDQINDSVTSVLSDGSSSFEIQDYLGFGRIVGLTLVLSAINVVITTAIAAIGARLYNLAAQLMGGVEVTLAED